LDKQNPRQNKSVLPVAPKPKPPFSPESAQARDIYYSPNKNTYFTDVATKIRIGFFICIVSLVAIIFFGLAVFSSEITTTNVQHLIRAFSIAFSPSETDNIVFAYDSDSQMAFATFGPDFAVASTRGVVLFDRMGNTAFRNQQTFTNPQLISAAGVNGRLLAYDRGGFGFAIYNSFGLMHQSTNLEFPIFAAAVAGNGTYAIATRNRIARSEIFIYNHNFNRLSAITNSGHIISLDISADGRHLLMVFANTNAIGQNITDIKVFYIATATDSREVVFQETITNSTPIDAMFNDSGGITVLLSSGLIFFDSEYNISTGYQFSDRNYTEFLLGTNMTAIIYREAVVGNRNGIILIDNNGEIILQNGLVGRISRIAISQDYLYVAVTGKLYRFHVDGSIEYIDRDSGLLALLPLADGEILLCYSATAYRAVFANAVSETTPE